MKNSIEILDEIMEKAGDDWKKYLIAYLKKDDKNSGEINEFSELLHQFVVAYKEDILDSRTSLLKEVEAKLNDDLLLEDLKACANSFMEAYIAINPLRVLEVQNYKLAVKLVDFIFEQTILRCNPEASNQYGEYGLGKEEEIQQVMEVLDSLCTFIVSGNLHRCAIGNVVRFNTRLSRELSEYIADIIDQHFERLQTKILIERLFPAI